jgi:hypothetical protein
MLVMWAFAAIAADKVVCSGGLAWEEITYETGAELADAEKKAASVALREPQPTAPFGRITVRVSRATLESNTGEHFTVAFGDPAQPDSLERRPQGHKIPTAVSGVWHNLYVEDVPSALPVTVHFIDEIASRRCSATIDTEGSLKRVK